jgi:hypothetical protein
LAQTVPEKDIFFSTLFLFCQRAKIERRNGHVMGHFFFKKKERKMDLEKAHCPIKRRKNNRRPFH